MSLLANQRARSVTEIIDASVQFCRAHALALLTIAAVVAIPPAVLEHLVPEGFRGVVTFAGNLVFSLGGAAASLYTVDVISGQEASIGQAFRVGSRRFGKVIAAQILFGLAVVVGTVLLVVPGLIFFTRYSLGTTIAAVEGANSSKSMERSWALTKGHGRHVFGTLALCGLISLLVLLGGAFVAGAAGAAVGLDESQTDLIVEVLVMLIAPFVWVTFTMLYIDVRVRVEGADIAAMVAELPKAPTGTPVA